MEALTLSAANPRKERGYGSCSHEYLNVLFILFNYIYIYIYIYKHKSFYVTICYICTHCRKRSWLFGDDSVKVKAHKIDPVVYSKMTTFRRWRWVVGFMPQLPYTWDIASCTQRKRNWVDIKVGLDALEKKTIPLRLSGIELLTVGRCFRSQVTILAELSGS